MDWQTPDAILDRVRRVRPIGLDPCTVSANPTGAGLIYTLADNGLNQTWCGHGLVFVNPPYGRAIGEWMRKCRCEALAGAEIISLIPARTDTAWWSDNVVASASALCCVRGRLTFRGGGNAAPFPSAAAYWGPDVGGFGRAFWDMGWIIIPDTHHPWQEGSSNGIP